MDIRPARADDVRLGRDGRQYLVTAEAGSVAADLVEIDPRLFVTFHEPPTNAPTAKPYYSIGCKLDDGSEDLVMRVRQEDFDARVVAYLRERNFELRHGISQADRLDAIDDARAREAERKMHEHVGEHAYALMRAVQKDILGFNSAAGYRPRPRFQKAA